MLITLNYTSNGFSYKQDFSTVFEAQSEMFRIGGDATVICYTGEGTNFNYLMKQTGDVLYTAKEGTGCSDGLFGSIGYFHSHNRRMNLRKKQK